MRYFVGIYVIVVDRGRWFDSHTRWAKAPLSITRDEPNQMDQTKNLAGNLTRFSNRYRYRFDDTSHLSGVLKKACRFPFYLE